MQKLQRVTCRDKRQGVECLSCRYAGQFGQRIRRFREWAQTIPIEQVKEKVLDLCKKAPEFKKSFSYPMAYRTSNALDRLMDYQDRMPTLCTIFTGITIIGHTLSAASR
jgi:hypothetical protein